MWRASRGARSSGDAPAARPARPFRPRPVRSDAASPGGDFGRLIGAGKEREALAAFARLTQPTQRQAQLAFFAARRTGDAALMERLAPRLHAAVRPQAATALMAAQAEAGNAPRVLELLHEQGPGASGHAFAAAVTALGRAGRFADMEALVARAEAQGVRSAALYTAAMNSYRLAGRLDAALRLASRMRQGGVLPDELAYATLFAVYAKAGRLGDAQRLQAEVEGRGMALTPAMCHSLLAAAVAAARLDEADRWLARLRAQPGDAPLNAAEVYATALLALWRRTHDAALLRRVLALFDQVCADARLAPSRALLTTAASAAGKLGALSEVRAVAALYDRLGHARDAVFLAALLDAHVRARDTDGAETLFQEARRTGRASAAAYKSMVALYADLRRLPDALALLADAKRERLAQRGVYTEAIAACRRCNAPDEATRLEAEAEAEALPDAPPRPKRR